MNLIRTSAAARILGIHRVTLWVWVKEGRVTPAMRIGDEALFDEAYIRLLAESRKQAQQVA